MWVKGNLGIEVPIIAREEGTEKQHYTHAFRLLTTTEDGTETTSPYQFQNSVASTFFMDIFT